MLKAEMWAQASTPEKSYINKMIIIIITTSNNINIFKKAIDKNK